MTRLRHSWVYLLCSGLVQFPFFTLWLNRSTTRRVCPKEMDALQHSSLSSITCPWLRMVLYKIGRAFGSECNWMCWSFRKTFGFRLGRGDISCLLSGTVEPSYDRIVRINAHVFNARASHWLQLQPLEQVTKILVWESQRGHRAVRAEASSGKSNSVLGKVEWSLSINAAEGKNLMMYKNVREELATTDLTGPHIVLFLHRQ